MTRTPIEGLPPMVGHARNTWRVTPTPAGSDIVLTTEIGTGRNPARALIARKVLERMSMASELMLAGLTAAVAPTAEQDEQDDQDEEQP